MDLRDGKDLARLSHERRDIGVQERLATHEEDVPHGREEALHRSHLLLELSEICEGRIAKAREMRTAFAVEIAVVSKVYLEVLQNRRVVQHLTAKPAHYPRIARHHAVVAQAAPEGAEHSVERVGEALFQRSLYRVPLDSR